VRSAAGSGRAFSPEAPFRDRRVLAAFAPVAFFGFPDPRFFFGFGSLGRASLSPDDSASLGSTFVWDFLRLRAKRRLPGSNRIR
jgi:hypothetical protein